MRLFILIFGLVGLGMGVGEIFILKNLYEFRSQAQVTEGEVVDFVTSRGRKGGQLTRGHSLLLQDRVIPPPPAPGREPAPGGAGGSRGGR